MKIDELKELRKEYDGYFGVEDIKVVELIDAEIERIKRCQDIGFNFTETNFKTLGHC